MITGIKGYKKPFHNVVS